MVGGMDALQIGHGGFGRGIPVEAKVRILDGRQNSGQTLWPLGVSGTRAVLDHVGVGEQGNAHADRIGARNALVADDGIENRV